MIAARRSGGRHNYFFSLRGSYLSANLWVLSFAFFFLLTSSSPAEENSALHETNSSTLDRSHIPQEYGEVIYQSNGESSKQLYIIGLEHRDSLTRANGTHTAIAQAQACKIGEWLVRNQGLGLLLPEGFFTKRKGKTVLSGYSAEKKTGALKTLDINDLEKRLADNHTYVNAEMLLKKHYGLRTRQVEDKNLYDAVHDALLRLVINGENHGDPGALKSELDYLQGKRVAAMLQRVPAVISEEFQNNNIKNQRALFTIGISHLSDILKYLHKNKIEIPSPPLSGQKEDWVGDLNLAKERFGVTVIVPRELANDRKILRMTGLDKIVHPYGE
jgi:hypothetical protein